MHGRKIHKRKKLALNTIFFIHSRLALGLILFLALTDPLCNLILLRRIFLVLIEYIID